MKTMMKCGALLAASLTSAAALAQPPTGSWTVNVDGQVHVPPVASTAPSPTAPNAPTTTAPVTPPPPLPASPSVAPTPIAQTPDVVDRAAPTLPTVGTERVLHGFRLGYGYVANFDKPVKGLGGASLSDKIGMRSPHSMLIGYELMYRMTGQSWLNVILVGNVIVAGLEQSQFYPTGNALLGFEFNHSFQVGVGANLAPLKDGAAHTIFAAGWTPRAGSFYVPVHAFFIPDVDGVHRMGMTTGVTW